MSTTFPADPAAYRVSLERSRGGQLLRISVLAGSEMLATYDDDGGALSDLLRRAADEERADPYAGKLPSDRAIVSAALRDAGIDPVEA